MIRLENLQTKQKYNLYIEDIKGNLINIALKIIKHEFGNDVERILNQLEFDLEKNLILKAMNDDY